MTVCTYMYMYMYVAYGYSSGHDALCLDKQTTGCNTSLVYVAELSLGLQNSPVYQVETLGFALPCLGLYG